MSRLNPFQQYSQGENTITNNVLLLLSNLYELDSGYYEELISGITDITDYNASPSFRQQVSNGGKGIIDGQIHVRPSRIIIETKIKELERIEKLLDYTDRFKEHEQKILIHLSVSQYSKPTIKIINEKLRKEKKLDDVIFVSLTYQDIVDQLKSLSEDHTYDRLLTKLYLNFHDYCANMDLMPRSKHILRAMACGGSFKLNIDYQFYFDLASRGYSPFNYLGIYKEKAVRHVGKVENVIVADLEDGELKIHDYRHPVTERQEKRLVEAIQKSVESGWEDVVNSHRFFLLKDLHQTKFVKKSPGGIYRVRYFDLENYLTSEQLQTVSNISEGLKKVEWK